MVDGPAPRGFGWLAAVASRGYMGVHLFFVISGYCIAQLALRELRSGRDGGRFLRSRLLRIFPPYWTACIVAMVLALVALPFNHTQFFSSPASPGAVPGSVSHALGTVLLLDPLLGQRSYLTVAWTLSWEISFICSRDC